MTRANAVSWYLSAMCAQTCARGSPSPICPASTVHVGVYVSSAWHPSVYPPSTRQRYNQAQRWLRRGPPSPLPVCLQPQQVSHPGLCALHKHLCPAQPLPRPGAGAPQGSLGFTPRPCLWEMCTPGALSGAWLTRDGCQCGWGSCEGVNPAPGAPPSPARAVPGGAGGQGSLLRGRPPGAALHVSCGSGRSDPSEARTAGSTEHACAHAPPPGSSSLPPRQLFPPRAGFPPEGNS